MGRSKRSGEKSVLSLAPLGGTTILNSPWLFWLKVSRDTDIVLLQVAPTLAPLLDTMVATSPFVASAAGAAPASAASAASDGSRITAELAEYSTGRVEHATAEVGWEVPSASLAPELAITGVGLGHALVAHTAPTIRPTHFGDISEGSLLSFFSALGCDL